MLYPTTNNIKRLIWIDWAKVFAIYLVVLGHSLSHDNLSNFIHNLIYAFHMPFFFFISGVLYKQKDVTFSDFLKKEISTLIVPYIVVHVITNLLLIPTFVASGQIAWENLFYFATGDCRGWAGPSWFLLCLFVLRIEAFYLLKLRIVFQIIFVALACFLAYVFPYALYYRIDTTWMVLPFFVIGYHCKEYVFKLYNWYEHLVIMLISGGGVLFLVNLTGYTNVYLRQWGAFPFLYYPMALVGISFLVNFAKLLNSYSSRLLYVLSTGTIIIMGLHGICNFYLSILIKIFFPFLKGNGFIYSSFYSLVIVILLIIPIILLQKYSPILIGNRSINGTYK